METGINKKVSAAVFANFRRESCKMQYQPSVDILKLLKYNKVVQERMKGVKD